jgi:hypothetical protein
MLVKRAERQARGRALTSAAGRRRRGDRPDLQGGVLTRGYSSGSWGWMTAYRERIAV